MAQAKSSCTDPAQQDRRVPTAMGGRQCSQGIAGLSNWKTHREVYDPADVEHESGDRRCDRELRVIGTAP